MLQSMARDLANLERGLEQLKSRQEQLAGDNARAIEQLRASQDQMARDNAKTAEQLKAMASFTARVRQSQQPPASAAPLRTNATAPRQPAPTRPPPQTRVQP
jgi:ATPase subunit of ABC transporter with duplicated ATPase domains